MTYFRPKSAFLRFDADIVELLRAPGRPGGWLPARPALASRHVRDPDLHVSCSTDGEFSFERRLENAASRFGSRWRLHPDEQRDSSGAVASTVSASTSRR